MMEKEVVLKEGKISEKIRNILCFVMVLSLLIGLITAQVGYYDECERAATGGYYYNNYMGKYDFMSSVDEWIWGLPSTYVGLTFLFIAVVALVVFLVAVKTQIVVTNSRVYGRTYFGHKIDLPLDSISAVGSRWFNTISVSTSSSKIEFPFISGSREIHQTICELLVQRQNMEPNVELTTVKTVTELKKYKALLDEGIITQDEFEAKKKQLLNL